MIVKYNKLVLIAAIFSGFLFTVSCNSCQTRKRSNDSVYKPYRQVSPNFNPDSAYKYIEKQVNFGSRVPNTEAHRYCGDYLVAKLRSFGAKVAEQKADITHYNGQNLYMRNIIGSYQPEKQKRVLLAAHWDSRPFADQESDADKQKQPISGADDGASGVGILLEIARQLQQKMVNVGVDIIFFDLEDGGQPSFEKNFVQGDWWCLGSQYWSENPHVENYTAAYGILLDMVGAADATFLKEQYSVEYASNVVQKIWSTASKLGYGNFFVNRTGAYITDDHVPVNEYHRAPCADIIHTTNSQTGFAAHWHTLNDTMENINRTTLKAVGQTVMEVIYCEQPTPDVK